MSGFDEVAPRCWVARHAFLDVNVSVVAGSRGAVVIDSSSSTAAGDRVLEDLHRLGAGPLLAVVNTHHHFDHTFGNLALAGPQRREESGEGAGTEGVEVIAHEAAALALPDHAEQTRRAAREAQAEEGAEDAADHAAIAATRLRLPDRTFSSVLVLDLGDRAVELLHPGPGHTAGDVVVRVEDADVLFAGDLVEESTAREAVPGYGSDCFPLEWPASLDLALGLVGGSTVVVPGHGSVVGQDFVVEQRGAIGVVAETIRDLAGRGVPLEEALEEGSWPYPAEHLGEAVRRGYEQLPRSGRRLPLI